MLNMSSVSQREIAYLEGNKVYEHLDVGKDLIQYLS